MGADPTFAYTWNSAFLATPADTEAASLGAQRIRDTKAAVGERFARNHSLNGDVNDGKHTYLDMVGVAASSFTPLDSGDGALYVAADGSGITQLYYINSNGQETKITDGNGPYPYAQSEFPSGTRIFVQQSAAPAGWVADATYSDCVLRVNSSGANFGHGGTWNITGVTVAGTTLTVAQMPAHTHTISAIPGTFSASGGAFAGSADGYVSYTGTTSSQGGGQSHTHGWSNDSSWRPSYLDCIVIVKS